MKNASELGEVRPLRQPHSAFIVFFFLMSAGLASSCGETFSQAPIVKSHAGAAGSPIGEPSGGGEPGVEAGGKSGTGGAPNPSVTAGSGGEGGADAGSGGEDNSGTSGFTGSGGEGPSPPEPCDWTAPVDGCTVSAKDGVFVTPEGDDDADGTPDQPLASVGEGVARVRAMVTPRPVFVCTATYDEHVEIRINDVRLQGGFACPENASDAWVYSAGTRPRLAPSTQGYALRVQDAERITVADFELKAANGAGRGDSSIAVFATNASEVAFVRTLIQSGDGLDGEPGVLIPHTFPELPPANRASGDTGAAPISCACPGSNIATVGGGGGNGGDLPTNGGVGAPLYPGTGAGGIADAECATLGRGQAGGDAPPASSGQGARALGSVTNSGWERSTADAGTTAAPGQGGGGGSGEDGITKGAHGGASGRCGGCGGNGGGAGRSGGASIGVLSYLSDVTLRESQVHTGAGGNGGNGASGQEGSSGGEATGTSCNSGGSGGKGGQGGTGGGGAGGISVGVVWTGGTEPTLEGTHVFTGEPGGPGGAEGVNRGIPGVSLAVLAAP